MHSELQTVLDAKLESARQSLREMGEALQPNYYDPRYALLESTGVLGNSWQSRKFWNSLDAFIVTIRSIPDVIQSWCGDHRLKQKAWFLRLSAGEKRPVVQLCLTDFGSSDDKNLSRKTHPALGRVPR
jgi:hypothetical protein